MGEGLRRSRVSRDEVFLETKVWISDYGYAATLHAWDKSARKLGVDRIDLLLLHQPLPSRFDLTLQAYRALETLLADGKVRAIGVSNFMPDHLGRLLAATSVVPAVNQIELHPYFQQRALQRLHAEHGILTQAWSVFDFELSKDQVTAIDALDTAVRRGPVPGNITLETYGKEIPEA